MISRDHFMTTKHLTKPTLDEALKILLTTSEACTQAELCTLLTKAGYSVNQSKISRLLNKIGAIKTRSSKKGVVYTLPFEPPPSFKHSLQLSSLIISIENNETMVLIKTSPGAASFIARLLDFQRSDTNILGTLAGDDTIFAIPKSIKYTAQLTTEIKALLMQTPPLTTRGLDKKI